MELQNWAGAPRGAPADFFSFNIAAQYRTSMLDELAA
jgi:hypothetical protein